MQHSALRHGWSRHRVGRHELAARVLAPAGARNVATPSPVVLVHGLGVSSQYLVPLLEQLGRDTATWAPDLPGHGHSSDPGRALGTGELVDVLDAWLDASAIASPLLVANSYGCQLVAELARRRADVVGVVLLGPATDERRRSIVQQAARLGLDATREPPHLVARIFADYLRTGPARTLREFRDSQQVALTRTLPDVTAPVTLVRGGRDPIAPARWLAELAASRPGSRVVDVPGHAHCAHFTAPRQVAALVLDLASARIPGSTG